MTAPYTGIQIPQPGQSLQRARRAWRIYTDQHGRRFGAQADMSNNMPIGEFQPQGFNPPWLPSMFYAKFRGEGELDFRWDYATLANEWSGDTASYYDEAVKLALQLPGDIPVPEIGGPVDRRIKALLGVAPLSPAIPLACEAGDPYMLGVIGAPVNETLKALLFQGMVSGGKQALAAIKARVAADMLGVAAVPTVPEKPTAVERVKTIHDVDDPGEFAEVTWSQFAAAARKRGKLTAAEISVAWAEHKANMKAEEIAA